MTYFREKKKSRIEYIFMYTMHIFSGNRNFMLKLNTEESRNIFRCDTTILYLANAKFMQPYLLSHKFIYIMHINLCILCI